jgi:plastocyanin
MKLMTVALVAAFVSGSVVAFAAEKTISQKGRAFSESAVTVKKGDTLTFINDDNIAHNIMSSTAGNEFNLGSQAPGASSNVTLGNAGEVAVLCAIHPRMKMSVTVTD